MVYSPINGQIKVIKYFGNISLQVDNLTQSGGLLKNIWNSGLQELNNLTIKQPASPAGRFNNVLVLGVGGGTVIQLIEKYFPNAKITGIEIDPEMIELGRKYLNLSENSNLKIIIADAISWVNKKYHSSNHGTFDLILVDLYIGNQSPRALINKEFLEKLKTLLSNHGIVIFNRLRNRETKEEIDKFIKKLKTIYPEVSIKKPLVNYLIICR